MENALDNPSISTKDGILFTTDDGISKAIVLIFSYYLLYVDFQSDRMFIIFQQQRNIKQKFIALLKRFRISEEVCEIILIFIFK